MRLSSVPRILLPCLLLAGFNAPAAAGAAALQPRAPADSVIAIVGATLIDGNGGAPLPDAVVIVAGRPP